MKTIYLKNFNWLLGKWKLSNGEEVYESWIRLDDHTFEGRGYTIKDGHEQTSESIKLEQRGEDMFYVPTVAHNLGPVDFRLVNYSGKLAIFENLGHDFPQRIKYRFTQDELLFAEIENKESTKRKQYLFKKVE